MADDNTTQMDSPDSPNAHQDVPLQIPELTEMDMLGQKITELENSISQYKDQLLRKAAEFENYKKRVENDYSSLVKFSNEDLILKLIPVIDDFERSLKARSTAGELKGEEESFMRGVELIYSKFKRILESQGVKTFESVGKPFDPNYHDALMQVPRADVPPHTVVDEIEKGYMIHDKVIRHARVIVSADAADGQTQPNT
ncbi:MAG: nucleotide exchange factor GrpE [Ignavibacteriae bacterium]|nr:nucleotide exchange factor GrpE [Ignavibacteria bacterium]MBI3363517.1 nucleotide exchange factor GrpE [Ignavibacteriota bacterium]